MSDEEAPKPWTKYAKIAVLFLPAIATSLSSYAKSRAESSTETSAAYMTLKKAVEDLRVEQARLEALCAAKEDHVVVFEDEPVTFNLSRKPKPTDSVEPPEPFHREISDAGAVVFRAPPLLLVADKQPDAAVVAEPLPATLKQAVEQVGSK